MHWASWLKAICAAVMWACCSTSAWAQPGALDLSNLLPNLTRQPVRLVTAGRPLADVQRQVEPSLGVRLILVGSISDMPVSGEISGADGMAFVRELSSLLRLNWAIGKDGIYLAAERDFRPLAFAAPNATVAFRTAALARREFDELGTSIAVTARKEEVTVTGIPGWLSQVAAQRVPQLLDFVQRTMAQQAAAEAAKAEEAARKLRERTQPKAESLSLGVQGETSEPLSLMVFRLNNAYVDDKRLNVGSTTINIPGVATLFRQFTGLGGASADGGSSAGNNDSLTRLNRVEPLAGGRTGAAATGEAQARTAPRPAGNSVTAANQPAVIADSRTNALIVRDRASMLEPYRSLVQLLDQAADMVQIDAFIIDIRASRLDEFGLGLSWAGGSGTSQVTRSISPGGSVPSGANVILQAARGVQLLAQIRALETNGDSEILTVPSVVTLNNLEATFSARQNFYVKVSGNQDASLNKVTAETLLRVTPLVAQTAAGNAAAADRRIRLLISVQDGSVDASQSATVDNLPRTLENQISTQAVVRGGDTLVIGGQVVRKRVSRVSGIPFIKDLPLLGTLTNSRAEDYEQFVRIYVVRPRLIGEDSGDTNQPVGDSAVDPQSHRLLDKVPEIIRGGGLAPRKADLNTGPAGALPSASSLAPTVPRLVMPLPAAPEPALQAPAAGSAADGSAPSAQDGGDARPANRKPSGRNSSTSSSGSTSSDAGDSAGEVMGDWNPDDPIWRPPGSPLGRFTNSSTPPSSRVSRTNNAPSSTSGQQSAASSSPSASAAGSGPNRVDASTQAARDRDARRILEAELLRAERSLARLEQESSQGNSAVLEALERARTDVVAIRRELERLTGRAGPAPQRPAPATPAAPAARP
jgi:type II secretory pathway component GspD/PulD (secretin)